MTIDQKRKWSEVRLRFAKSLKDETTILKQDLQLCWSLHLAVYEKPKYKPSINCCLDIALWAEMCKNLNKAFTQKTEE